MYAVTRSDTPRCGTRSSCEHAPSPVHARDGQMFVLTNSLDARAYLEGAAPNAELLPIDELGFYELLQDGTSLDEAELEMRFAPWDGGASRTPSCRAICRSRSPTACATPAWRIDARRRASSAGAPRQERWRRAAGIRRAQTRRRGRQGGRPSADARRRLATAARLDETASLSRRARSGRQVARPCGGPAAPAPPDIMVASQRLWSCGHDPAAGRCPPYRRSTSTCGRATRRRLLGAT